MTRIMSSGTSLRFMTFAHAVLLGALSLFYVGTEGRAAPGTDEAAAVSGGQCTTVYSSLVTKTPAFADVLASVPAVKAFLEDPEQSVVLFVPNNMKLLHPIVESGASLEDILKYHATLKSTLEGAPSVTDEFGTISYQIGTLLEGFPLQLTVSKEGEVAVNNAMLTGGVADSLCGGSVIEYIDDVLVPTMKGDGMLAQVELEDLLQNGKLPTDDPAAIKMFQEAITDNTCECTRSGYSGVSIGDDGAVTQFGNTSFVDCAAHINAELDGSKNVCYVLGGTECESAVASTISSAPFQNAAYRECLPRDMSPKFFWLKGELSWMKQFSMKNNAGLINIGCIFAFFGC